MKNLSRIVPGRRNLSRIVPGRRTAVTFCHRLFMRQDTFGRAKNWVKELQRQASPGIVIALAGNKADLANNRAVEYDVSSHHG